MKTLPLSIKLFLVIAAYIAIFIGIGALSASFNYGSSAALLFQSLCLMIPVLMPATIALVYAEHKSREAPTLSKKERRRKALRQHVQRAGGTEIYVKRIGAVGTYLEHFLINYRDSENQWQVRHVIRNQMKEKFFWDDPVVTYEREVSAEISQSKQQLINDLDVEIHQLRQGIAAANSKVRK